MALDDRSLLITQMLLSLVAWGSIVTVLILPRLAPLDDRTALRWLLAPQMLRHVGMSLLATNVAAPGLDPTFVTGVATGDLITMALSTSAFLALGLRARFGFWLAGLAAVVGMADLVLNIRNGYRLHAAEHLAAGWFVVAMIVPLMLVLHVATLQRLRRVF